MIILGIIIILIILILVLAPKFERYTNPTAIKKRGARENMDTGKTVMVYDKFWDEQDAKDHPDWLFIFGDNDLRSGKGGQAVIRNLPNAMGIPTKKRPDTSKNAYYVDSEIDDNRRKINQAVDNIQAAMNNYTTLVLPNDGLGTGLAKLDSKAPLTFSYLQYQIKNLTENIQPGSSAKIPFLQNLK